MANIYVRSTDGNNGDNGSTWALAKATLAGAGAIDVAGDNIYVSQSHSETTAGAVTVATAGTFAAPVKIICGNDGAEPPTAVATTGIVATTGASAITISGICYVYGLIFRPGDAGNAANFVFSGVGSVLDNCAIEFTNTNTGSVVSLSGNNTLLKNTRIKFGNTSQGIAPGGSTLVTFRNCVIDGSGSAITDIFRPAGQRFVAEGCDLSAAATAANIIASGNTGLSIIRNCKLPASWSGNLVGGAIGNSAARCEMYNCDSGDTNYRIWIEDGLGSLKSETTLVKTGGASDGVTPLSWKIVTTANGDDFPYNAFSCPERWRWNEVTGSPTTVTIDILHDSATALTDKEIWLEVQYLGTSGFPLASLVSDAAADILASASNQSSSSATWTTSGMTNPNTQKLNVTFTPQEKGFIIATVRVAKASYTVYVDPKLQVS